MRISDEKRHEVARKLRVLACTTDEIGITEHAVIMDLGISSGIYDDCCKSEDVLDVADLIDRPTCTIECECDAYSSWGERIDGVRLYEMSCGHQAVGYEKPRYCAVCGMEVV